MAACFADCTEGNPGDGDEKLYTFYTSTRLKDKKGRKMMPKKTKANLEFLLVKAEVKGVPEKALLKSRNIGQVNLIA